MRRAHALVIVGNGEGGGTHIALQVMRGLDPTRYQVTLITPYTPSIADICAKAGVRYVPLPLMESRIGRGAIAQVNTLIEQSRFDVIHAHGTRAAWFITRCKAAQPIPLIYSDHVFAFEARRGLARLPWRMIERYLCQRADFVTTPCEAEGAFAERTRSRSAAPVQIRRYGIDVNDVLRQAGACDSDGILPGIPPDAPIIGTVGRLATQKGVRYLIEAAPAILRRYPDAHFVIVGDGPERGRLEARSVALGIERRVHFTGAMTRPWSALARCSVIALPSLWEGMPLTLLEALALGMPLVVTPVGIAEQELRPTLDGAIINRRDARGLALAVNRLLGDTALRERFRLEGPRIAARYDIRETQRAFAALYDSVCGHICGEAPSDFVESLLQIETVKRPAANLALSPRLGQHSA